MDTNLLLKAYLKRLRLPAMTRELDKTLAEAAAANLPYDRFLLALVEHEVTAREQNMLRLRVRQARFPVLKTLDSFEFTALPSLPKMEVLQLAQGEYIAQARNVCLIGNSGTGKTHVAIGLGVEACRKGYHVRFYTAAGLATEMLEASAQHRLSRLERQLEKMDLVVLDELGYVPFSRDGAELLFAFCSGRYERASILITSNLEFQQWTEVFGNAKLTGALVDRVTHRASILPMIGESYRFRQAQAEHLGSPGPKTSKATLIEDITPMVSPEPKRPGRRGGRSQKGSASATNAAEAAMGPEPQGESDGARRDEGAPVQVAPHSTPVSPQGT